MIGVLLAIPVTLSDALPVVRTPLPGPTLRRMLERRGREDGGHVPLRGKGSAQLLPDVGPESSARTHLYDMQPIAKRAGWRHSLKVLVPISATRPARHGHPSTTRKSVSVCIKSCASAFCLGGQIRSIRQVHPAIHDHLVAFGQPPTFLQAFIVHCLSQTRLL